MYINVDDLNPIYLGGEGQNDPQWNKCLRNSENRKNFFKKTTNYAIQCKIIVSA